MSALRIFTGSALSFLSNRSGVGLGIIILAMYALTGSSCGPRDVFLDSVELKLIDSLYTEERKIWQVRLADSCHFLREQHYHNLVDSIREERLFEVREMIKRYE